jgi:hypothetical protein
VVEQVRARRYASVIAEYRDRLCMQLEETNWALGKFNTCTAGTVRSVNRATKDTQKHTSAHKKITHTDQDRHTNKRSKNHLAAMQL